MQHTFKYSALVIRAIDYSDNDKLLTLLTAENGKITVRARGAKSLKNKNLSAIGLLCYSEFVINEKGGYYTLSEASLIEQFYGLRESVAAFAAAQYAADAAGDLCIGTAEGKELLSLTLNTLYMLSTSKVNADEIKAIFEIRSSCLAGFKPDLDCCAVCGSTDAARTYIDVMNGNLKCSKCAEENECHESGGYTEGIKGGRADGSVTAADADIGSAAMILPVSAECLDALRYTSSCPPKRIFAYRIPEKVRAEFCNVCEKYFLNHVDHGFKTLDFYKSVRHLG